MPMLAAANMDPQAITHPETRPCKKAEPPVAFGTGIDFCLGHQLARIEGSCALKACSGAGRSFQLAVDRIPNQMAQAARPQGVIQHLPVTASR